MLNIKKLFASICIVLVVFICSGCTDSVLKNSPKNYYGELSHIVSLVKNHFYYDIESDDIIQKNKIFYTKEEFNAAVKVLFFRLDTYSRYCDGSKKSFWPIFSRVSPKTIYSSSIDGDTLRVKISLFEDGISSMLQEDTAKYHPKHMIIDLQNNPGGKIKEAIKMIDLFISSGKIVTLVKKNHTQTYLATKTSTYQFDSVTVLVNKNTASSAELVAKALEKYIGATLVGGKTYGKNTIQALIYLDEAKKECLRLTIGKYQL